MPNPQRYVLVTPVRNEEAFIEMTLNSVVNQTCLPERWVIVSNNSSDRTDAIVARYAERHPFIEHVTATLERTRDFSVKVRAFERGYAMLRGLDYDYIGNLDGDIAFNTTLMESLLGEFARNPGLGIGGALITEKVGSRVRRQITSTMHVSGSCQMFRRRCFEDIGGYLPLKHGGEDTAADVMARMKGWAATTFLHLEIRHGRRCGTAMGGLLQARYRDGVLDYTLGKPPLVMAAKTVRRLVEDPLVLGSFARLAGFVSASSRAEKRVVSEEFVRFIRKEELRRLFTLDGRIGA